MLPASIWHRMSDDAGALRRYLRVPTHAWQTYRALKKYLRQNQNFDVIFIPTVLVHHLLGWTWLIKKTFRHVRAKVILFFPNTPIHIRAEDGRPAWLPAPTAKLFCRLIHSLQNEVKQGRVILGAETLPMRDALTNLCGVPFTYFPHPVAPSPHSSATFNSPPSAMITMASYGGARHEKGSDLLVAAVNEFCRRHPDSRVQFVLQNVGGNAKDWECLKGNLKSAAYSCLFRGWSVFAAPDSHRRTAVALPAHILLVKGFTRDHRSHGSWHSRGRHTWHNTGEPGQGIGGGYFFRRWGCGKFRTGNS